MAYSLKPDSQLDVARKGHNAFQKSPCVPQTKLKPKDEGDLT